VAKVPRKKPGPKARRLNPHPASFDLDDGSVTTPTKRVPAADLADTEFDLRRYFKKRRAELKRQSNESIPEARIRLRSLVKDALTKTGAAWWSEAEWTITPLGPPMLSGKSPEASTGLLNLPLPKIGVTVDWKLSNSSLNASITRLLDPKFRLENEREEKSGRPAYLACAALAALLNVSPVEVADFLANHRRSTKP
jgi:hypothetical protein